MGEESSKDTSQVLSSWNAPNPLLLAVPQDSGSRNSSEGGHGRPLSVITASDIGDETNGEGVKGAEDSAGSIILLGIPSHDIPGRRTKEDLQEQVYELFQRFVPPLDSTTEDKNDETIDESADHSSSDGRTVLSRDLPHLLSEFERQQGAPLIEENSRPQLEQFCEEFPDHVLRCDDLVNIITGLEQARYAAQSASEEEDSADDSADLQEEAATGSSSSSGPSRASSPSEARLSDHRVSAAAGNLPSPSTPPRSSTPVRERMASRPEFSRSQSMQGGNLTIPSPEPRHPTNHRIETLASHPSPSRARTTSASAAPTSEREKVRSSTKQDRRRSQQEEDRRSAGRDILRGKGNAPPSSWQRPRPQALATTSRVRRTSDVSASSSQDRDTFSDGRPRRGPMSASPSWSENVEDATSQRLSSGYIFPRATSPGDETWYAEQEEKWEHTSERARSASSRAASPDRHESPLFQSFAPLSSSRGPGGGGGGGSGLASPRRNDIRSFSQALNHGLEEGGSGDLLVDLQKRYDQLSRLLQDKERSFESTQSSHEISIAELETRVEQLQDRIHSLTKTNDEMKQKEQRYLDEISRLENDLATSQKRCESLDRLRDIAQQDTSARETSIVALQGKVNDLQERLVTLDREEAAHMDSEREWEYDREQYRKQIEKLRSDLREAMDKEAQVESLSLEKEGLQAQLRELQSDLEEARSRSGFLPGGRGDESVAGTVSKRLGRELAGALESIVDDGLEDHQNGSGSEDKSHEHRTPGGDDGADPDESHESVVITTTRRRRVHQRSEKALKEISTQTMKGNEGGRPSTGAPSDPSPELSPPTYDEAAMEKAIIARLHPPCTKLPSGSRPGLPAGTGLPSILSMFDDGESISGQYRAFTKVTGLRCVVLEKAVEDPMRTFQDDDDDAAQDVASWASHKPGRSVSGMVCRHLASGASRVYAHLPPSAHGGLSRMSRWEPQMQLVAWSLILVAISLLLGSTFSSRQQHLHFHGPSGGLYEDGTSWLQANSFGGHGTEFLEIKDSTSGFLGRLTGYLLGTSSRRVQTLVPI